MRRLCVGVDIGTDRIKLVSVEKQKSGGKAQIVSFASYPSRGFAAGYVADHEEARASLARALKDFHGKQDKQDRIECYTLVVGGPSLTATTIISRKKLNPEEEILPEDVESILRSAEENFRSASPNRVILHTIPVRYHIDGELFHGNPIGMFGSILEFELLIVSVHEKAYDELISLLLELGVEVGNELALPIAEAQSSLNYRQRLRGVSLVHLGANTTTVSTFEHGALTFLKTHPIGSNHITNDIALGLQIPLDEAERIKLGEKRDQVPKRKVESIILARLEDIADLVKKDLREGRKPRYLPAGVLLTGGGAQFPALDEFFRKVLPYPVEVVKVGFRREGKRQQKILPPEYLAAYGAALSSQGQKRRRSFRWRDLIFSLKQFFRELMP